MYPESKPVNWLFPSRKSHIEDFWQGHAYSGSALNTPPIEADNGLRS
jgi:hypothetical protein